MSDVSFNQSEHPSDAPPHGKKPHAGEFVRLALAIVGAFAGGAALLAVLVIGSMFVMFGHGPVQLVSTEHAIQLCDSKVISVDTKQGVLKDFKLTFEFLSNSDGTFTFSETGPPMPLLMSPLMIYQTAADSYEAGFQQGQDSISKAWRGDSWQSFSARYESDTLVITGNGVELVRRRGPVGLNGPGTIGRGFLKRYWCGWIRKFDLTATYADGQTVRLRLDGDKVVPAT